jgi:hypothetical protein
MKYFEKAILNLEERHGGYTYVITPHPLGDMPVSSERLESS